MKAKEPEVPRTRWAPGRRPESGGGEDGEGISRGPAGCRSPGRGLRGGRRCAVRRGDGAKGPGRQGGAGRFYLQVSGPGPQLPDWAGLPAARAGREGGAGAVPPGPWVPGCGCGGRGAGVSTSDPDLEIPKLAPANGALERGICFRVGKKPRAEGAGPERASSVCSAWGRGRASLSPAPPQALPGAGPASPVSFRVRWVSLGPPPALPGVQ